MPGGSNTMERDVLIAQYLSLHKNNLVPDLGSYLFVVLKWPE